MKPIKTTPNIATFRSGRINKLKKQPANNPDVKMKPEYKIVFSPCNFSTQPTSAANKTYPIKNSPKPSQVKSSKRRTKRIARVITKRAIPISIISFLFFIGQIFLYTK